MDLRQLGRLRGYQHSGFGLRGGIKRQPTKTRAMLNVSNSKVVADVSGNDADL